jgi:hypothetical protein
VTVWKTELLEKAAGIFGGDELAADGRELIRELHEKVGELTVGRDFSYGPFFVNKQIDAHRGTTLRIIRRMSNAASELFIDDGSSSYSRIG